MTTSPDRATKATALGSSTNERIGPQGLGSVAKRRLRRRVDFEHDAVRSCRHGGPGQRRDAIANADGMARVDEQR